MSLAAGVLSGMAIAWVMTRRSAPEPLALKFWILPVMIAGLLAVLTLTTYAFTLQRLGVTATFVAVILGQTVAAVIVDRLGWTGAEPVLFTPRLIAGLAAMSLAVVLIAARD
jgi:uncharacterized membrane protein YdcZ (DUF606 family)